MSSSRGIDGLRPGPARRLARGRHWRNGQPADVGLLGDRILAVGDLSAVSDADVETVLDIRGRVVAPGFIDPHGHSDGSVMVDGALDLVTVDPVVVADAATYTDPARYPIGISDVMVNGRPAILAGAETGERPGRLLRRT